MGWLYRIKHKINKKAYVGQTIRPIQVRLEEHRKGKSKGCRLIYNAIKKHGWENFDIDCYECPDEELNEHEEFLVEVLGTLTPNGYNLVGGGGSNGKMSEETKQKHREARLGKPKSKEHNKKNSEAHLGKKNPFYGKKHTEETKQKNREAQLGRKNPNPDTKIVYQYDLDGNFINSFASSDEAALQLNKHSGSGIGKCARGKRKTAYDFKWSHNMDIFI